MNLPDSKPKEVIKSIYRIVVHWMEHGLQSDRQKIQAYLIHHNTMLSEKNKG